MRHNQKVDPAMLRRLHKRGSTIRDMCAIFDCDPETVRRWHLSLNLVPNRRPGKRVETGRAQHGGMHAWRKYGCRCDMCRSGNRARQQNARAARLLRTVANGGIAPVEVHGGRVANNWGCRCKECLAAKAIQHRAYKALARTAA